MGLLDKLFKREQKKDTASKNDFYFNSDLPLNQNPTEEYICPLWKSIPSDENRQKDKDNQIDYATVLIYFSNGEIIDVIPDVNNYYLASKYVIDGEIYDISNIESVNKIPLPTSKAVFSGSLGTPVYRLEYLLRLHAGFERDNGNIDLSYALIHKGTEMLPYSSLEWKRHDYLREYFWLLDDDRIEDADLFFNNIKHELPAPYSDKEHTKEIQHRNYAILKRSFNSQVPKSFSAYMRIYNKQDEKYSKLVALADSINLKL